MAKKILFWAAAAAAVGAAAFFVIRHLTTTEEDRVRSAVNALVADLKKDNIPLSLWGLRKRISDKYVHRGEDADFRIDKELALAYILRLKQALGYMDFDVEIHEMTVSVDGDRARVAVTGRITAATKEKPDRRIEVMTESGLNKAVLDFQKEDGDWMIAGSERVKHRLD